MINYQDAPACPRCGARLKQSERGDDPFDCVRCGASLKVSDFTVRVVSVTSLCGCAAIFVLLRVPLWVAVVGTVLLWWPAVFALSFVLEYTTLYRLALAEPMRNRHEPPGREGGDRETGQGHELP